MSNKGKLVVLSAPSGAGKTSICKELLKYEIALSDLHQVMPKAATMGTQNGVL